MGSGWIKLHRKLLDSLIFGNEKGLKVWIWCLLRANHAEKSILLGRQKITLKPGQFVMGSKKESETLKLAKTTLWYWLDFLEKEGQLELKKTTKYTVITIPKWEEYQHDLDSNGTQIGTQMGTNKNEKNVKNMGGKPPELPIEEKEESSDSEEKQDPVIPFPYSVELTRERWQNGELRLVILDWYFAEKGLWKKATTRQKLKMFMARHNAAAVRIAKAGWERGEVMEAKNKALFNEQMKDEWTLETIEKYLSK